MQQKGHSVPFLRLPYAGSNTPAAAALGLQARGVKNGMDRGDGGSRDEVG
jgi:hypothetical protein